MNSSKEKVIEKHLQEVYDQFDISFKIDYTKTGNLVDLEVEVERNAIPLYKYKKDKKRIQKVMESISLCIYKQINSFAKQSDSVLTLCGIRLKKLNSDTFKIFAELT
jgi:hypothetical protein